MLYGRINKEYVNEDDIAKRTVFKLGLAQVKKLRQSRSIT